MATHSSVLAWEVLWTDLFQKTNVHRMVLSSRNAHPSELTDTFPGLLCRPVFTLLLMPGTAPGEGGFQGLTATDSSLVCV